MGFQRHRPFDAQHLHQLADEEDAIEEILFLVRCALEYLGETAAQRLEVRAAVADDKGADGGAADDEHFVWKGVQYRAKIASGKGEPPEDHADQNDDTNDCEHAVPHVKPIAWLRTAIPFDCKDGLVTVGFRLF